MLADRQTEQGGQGDDDVLVRIEENDKKRKRAGSGDPAPEEANAESGVDQKRSKDVVLPTKRFELAKMNNRAKLSEIIEGQEPVTKSLIPEHIEDGVLIPLKTTLELRDDHQCGQVLITRTPIRSTSAVIR